MNKAITIRNHEMEHGAAIVSDMISGTDEHVNADGILSDERAECSYGMPVVVIDGSAYGAADLPGYMIVLADDGDPDTADLAQRAKLAGYTITRPVPGIDYPDF